MKTFHLVGSHVRKCGLSRWRQVVVLATLVILSLAGYITWQSQQSQDPYKSRATALVARYRFSIPRWEVGAVRSEVVERFTARRVNPDLPEDQRRVLDYLETAQRIGALEGEIERTIALSSDREQAYAQIAPLQAEVDALRARQAKERPYVERILERQMSQVIADEGVGWLGRPLPPIAFQFAEPPYYLILSPRDEIRMRLGIHLVPSLSLETREGVEETMERELPNTSALVEGIGGFSTWPTMIIDRASVEWVLSTIAHEWTHTYLIAFPLGRHYYESPDTSAINETVADIVGQELGRKALQRYYPQLVPPPTPTPSPPSQLRPLPTPEPPAFDFNREMRITREKVDRLLAEGKVEEAEAYMEERRQFFLQHGYFLRKLNQAYFAFHGTYRTGPAAPAEDPIAPRLRKLRQESPSLAAFLEAVRDMTTLDDLLARVPEP